MTVTPEPPSPDLVEMVDEAGRTPGLRALRLRGLLSTLVIGNLVLCVFWGAIQTIFLALQVQRIDGEAAAGSLAIVIGLGAIGAMVGAPVAGAVTDRTRSRFGGRAPWIVAGAAAAAGLSVLLAFATSVAQLAVLWVLLQVATNFILTPMSVHIPERVPVGRRGLFSGTVGLAQLGGNTIGATAGAVFATAIPLGYAVVGAALLVASLAFAAVNRRSNTDLPRARTDIRAILRTFWVNPVRHPDFAWVFFGRFLLMVGYFPLISYLLYLLQDYVGLGKGAVAAVPIVSAALLLGSVLGGPAAGLLADRLRATKPVILGASVVLIAGFVAPLVSPTLTGMLVYGLLAGFGLSAYLAVDYVLVTQVLPSAEEAGKDLGIINVTTTLPQTIGVAAAGALVTLTGGYTWLFPVAIGLVVVGALCLFRVRGAR